MKRWAICRMGEWVEPNEVIPRVGLYAAGYRCWSRDGMQWGLCHFAVDDLAAINSDAMIKVLPDATLDAAWSTIPNAVRNQVKSAMEAAGCTWAVQNTWPVRQVLNYCVTQIQPGIDVTVGDVRDV